jgi:hypothetical protein
MLVFKIEKDRAIGRCGDWEKIPNLKFQINVFENLNIGNWDLFGTLILGFVI